MKFFNAQGVLTRARRFISGSAGIQEDQVKDPAKLQELLRDLQRRTTNLETRVPPEGLEIELNVGANGSLVRVPHNFKGPIRWYVVTWTQTGGVTYPILGHALVQDASSDANTLVLRSYVTGRAIIRVEHAFVGIDPGATVPYVAPPAPLPTEYNKSLTTGLVVTGSAAFDVINFPVGPNEAWAVSFFTIAQSSLANGLILSVSAPAGSSGIDGIETYTTTVGSRNTTRINGTTSATGNQSNTSASLPAPDEIFVWVKTGANAGNVAIRCSPQGTNPTITFMAGTRILAKKLTEV